MPYVAICFLSFCDLARSSYVDRTPPRMTGDRGVHDGRPREPSPFVRGERKKRERKKREKREKERKERK